MLKMTLIGLTALGVLAAVSTSGVQAASAHYWAAPYEGHQAIQADYHHLHHAHWHHPPRHHGHYS